MYGLKNRTVRMSIEDIKAFAAWVADGNMYQMERGYRVQGAGQFATLVDVQNYFMKEFIAEDVLDLKFEDRRDWYGE